MKNQSPRHSQTTSIRGYATLAIVSGISLILILSLTYSLVRNLSSFDSQITAQLKQDYSQKEDAVLSALLHVVPNKAIGAMQQGSADNTSHYTWEKVFEEALTLANGEQAADSSLLASLNLSNSITANTGDTIFDSVANFVSAADETPYGSDELVNGGNWWEYTMLFNNEHGPKIPAPLRLSYDHYQLDKEYPIISFEKLHVYNYTQHHSRYYKGLYASTDVYPLYNLIEYPDVKFGYKRPGDRFVAKRNWWIFSLTFGGHNQNQTGIPPVKKNYVLSIYEVPSQLPLSAASGMQVGQFSDGSTWENVSLDGGLYADSVETQGTVALTDGSISARSSVTLSATTSVKGNTLQTDFDAMGSREGRALQSQSDFYDASVAGNVGKVAFIPLNPGADFLKLTGDGSSAERISPTGWNHYTRGAEQAKMRIEIREMTSVDSQVPVSIRFHYYDTSNDRQSLDYTRGSNWPTEIEAGGDLFPFQTDQLENGRYAMVINIDRIKAFLETISNAEGVDINNSLYIYPNHTEATVIEPSIPSLDTDLAISLRGGQDLTDFTKGLSILTDMRLYIAETINRVASTPPLLSGLPSTAEYYPPVSLFAPEKRFGESMTIDHPVNIRGQLSSLKTESTDTFNPMELMGADDTRVEANMLNASLVDLKSPAELPPIHLMNWLVTIEELH
tara:strand:+ start:612 stop:2639 length:2028 start_codon:yes stop_codon:yes gene_type:complete